MKNKEVKIKDIKEKKQRKDNREVTRNVKIFKL